VDDSVIVREATTGDELDVRRVLDAAMLESTATSDAVARSDAFVAVAGGDEGTRGDERVDENEVFDERVVGALVLVPHSKVELPAELAGSRGMHVDAVAVRRRRRGRGIGRALLAAALDREHRLTVAFDPGVGAFYDALDFTTVVGSEERVDGRAWAVRETDDVLGG
jgi:GNAT superfamily N-acetyltransferase